jgi:tRNA (guanine-N7-)-methyltransferase
VIEVDLNQVAVPLDLGELFGREAATDVEIGSGKGRFLNLLAADQPERNLLAVERANKYYKLCASRAARRGLENVRLIRTTAEDLLLRLLAPGSVATFYVLFPDPWPKKRHHKRRLFKPEIAAALATALQPSGRLLVKSDHAGYAEVIGQVLAAETGLESIDCDEAFDGLPLSGFEYKYQEEGRPIYSFACRRLPTAQVAPGTGCPGSGFSCRC